MSLFNFVVKLKYLDCFHFDSLHIQDSHNDLHLVHSNPILSNNNLGQVDHILTPFHRLVETLPHIFCPNELYHLLTQIQGLESLLGQMQLLILFQYQLQ